jgi:hypothetical protein
MVWYHVHVLKGNVLKGGFIRNAVKLCSSNMFQDDAAGIAIVTLVEQS